MKLSPAKNALPRLFVISSLLLALGCERGDHAGISKSAQQSGKAAFGESLLGLEALPKSCVISFAYKHDAKIQEQIRNSPVGKLWNAISEMSNSQLNGEQSISSIAAGLKQNTGIQDTGTAESAALEQFSQTMKFAAASALMKSPEKFFAQTASCALPASDSNEKSKLTIFSTSILRNGPDSVRTELDAIEAILRKEGVSVKRDVKGPITVYSVTLPQAPHSSPLTKEHSDTVYEGDVVTYVLGPDRLTISNDLALAVKGNRGIDSAESLATQPRIKEHLAAISPAGAPVGVLYLTESPHMRELTGAVSGTPADKKASLESSEMFGVGLISFESRSGGGRLHIQGEVSSEKAEVRQRLTQLAESIPSLELHPATQQSAITVAAAAGTFAKEGIDGLLAGNDSSKRSHDTNAELIPDSLTISLAPPSAASPFPDIYLTSAVKNPLQALQLLKQLVGGVGMLSPWKTQKIANHDVELAQSPLGIGAYLAAQNEQLIGATSPAAIERLLTTDKGGQKLPAGTVFAIKGSGPHILELANSMQSTLSLFTGGAASSAEALKPWESLKDIEQNSLLVRLDPKGAVQLIGVAG